MKIRIAILFACFFSNISCNHSELFIIGGRRHAGFFSNFLGALNNILWSESHNRHAVVYWGENVPYYDDSIKDTNNVWNYYFEPFVAYEYPIENVWNKYEDPSGTWIPFRSPQSCFANSLRNKYHSIIKKYVRLKSHVQKKIDTFYDNNFKGIQTIGIHLRGTDKKTEIKPVDCRRIFDAANRLAQTIGKCQFFIATDEYQFVQEAKKFLQGKVVLYDAYRSTDGKPIHIRKPSPYQLGEEVLVEAYLLSRCNYFLHTCSNVSISVCMINPALVNYLFV